MKTGIVCFMAVILVWRGDILVAQPYINYAAGKPVTASNPTKQLQLINDESLISGEARANPGGELFWIAIDLTADFGIGGMHLHLDQAGILPLRNFYFEYRTEGKWLPLPDGRFKNNFSAELALDLPESISMNAIRLLTDSENVFGIVEWQLWGTEVPALPHGVQRTVAEPYIPDKHWVCVNQVAYNHGQPKGFTVPTAKSDLPFQILERSSGNVVYTGRLSKGKGDFTDFNPESSTASEFFIRIPDGDGLPGADSYPFVIGRRAIQRMAYGPNVAFWNDVRSMVGSHPSAYGGTAWRDGTYYTYEVPAMILMYLSDPEAFENMPVTIDWNADKGRILAPDYSFIRARNDKDALHTVRTYYQDFPPPMHNKVPDIVQAIRFGAAWNLIDPVSHDPSGDILGERMHGQTIEQFAFFLFAYPAFRHQISQDFYQMVLDSTMQWWEEAGLFEVITTVGGPKGRHCPGHSILPNLLMYEVAMREQIAQPERFLEAARKQTEWIIEEADWYNPAFTKGQRISEHKLVTGLSVFLLNYPEEAPAGLAEKLREWAEVVVEHSDNLWDFRRFDLQEHWTLPGYNEAGNVIGFPACALSVAMTLDEGPLKERLVELAFAHFDNFSGRNPQNAHCANHPDLGFEGIEKGWPYGDPRRDVCARLEHTRGSLSSLPGSEMYPFNPNGKPRHGEGWTAYNAAWNVSLAFLNFYERRKDGVREIESLKSIGQQDD